MVVPIKKNNIPRAIFFTALCCLLLASTGKASSAKGNDTEGFFFVEKSSATVGIDTNEILLKELVEKIKTETGVEIRGLENRRNSPVTFSYRGRSLEIVLRQLLRQLGETNFVYEFENDKLTRITVFPKGDKSAPIVPSHTGDNQKNEFTTVVEIMDILEESQAKNIGLKKGDYIYKYDNQRIFISDQLIEKTTVEGDATSVDMVVISNGIVKRVTLERGFIGVQVRTDKISQDQIPGDINLF